MYPIYSGGRPEVLFEEASDRIKNRKIQDLIQTTSTEKLVFATSESLRRTGNTNASSVLKDITTTTLTRAKKYRTAFKTKGIQRRKKLCMHEALQLFVDADLSRSQYILIRKCDKDVFPPYNLLLEAKNKCYPEKDSIIISENSAEVKLQPLVNHTAKRLSEYLQLVLQTLDEEEKKDL